MKIVCITTFPDIMNNTSKGAGVSWYSELLLKNINHTRKDSVYVICDKFHNEKDVKRCVWGRLNLIRLFNKDYRFVFQIIQEIRRIDPDIIHIQHEQFLFGNLITSYLFIVLLFFLRRYQVVVTLHGVISLKIVNKKFIKANLFDFPVWLVKLGFQVLYSPICFLSKKIIVHERYFKDILVREYRADASKIEVIPLGVENLKQLDLINARKLLDIDVNRKVVLFMGYLAGYKGVELLLDGFSLFAKDYPEALLLVGAGIHPKFINNPDYMREYERIKSKALNLSCSNQIKWVGFIDEQEVALYYSASDLAVYPYLVQMSSSGPMAISMSYGKPFIVSKAFAHVFADYPSLLFDLNPLSLKTKLIEFFDNRAKFSHISLCLKNERIWSKVGQLTYNVYNELIVRQ